MGAAMAPAVFDCIAAHLTDTGRSADDYDLIATGGTIKAAAELVEELGGEVVKILFLLELKGLEGRKVLEKYNVESVVAYDGK